MQKLLTFSLLFFMAAGPLFAQDSLNMHRLGYWDDNALPLANPGGLNLQYSGCWAIALGGKEYAVVGGAEHVLFFDITNPASPQMIGKFAGTANTIWREFKSYKNRVYAVSDGTDEGLMVFDLTNTPQTGTVVRTYFKNEFFGASHTITLDTISGNIYLNGGSSGNGMIVLNVKDNPDKPVLATQVIDLPGGILHDSYVRNDTLYASHGTNGYYIYDFKTNVAAPKQLATISTGGYNHNSWVTTDGRYAFYTEEVPNGLPIRVVDLKNLTTTGMLEVVHAFLDTLTPTLFPGIFNPKPTPHNVYIKDNLLYDSQYEDGLLVYDISVPTAPVLIAHYDTHPQNTKYNGYFGNWGNYPWLPSGTIVSSDMQNGLQLLKLGDLSSVGTPAIQLAATIAPNPVQDQLSIQVSPQQLAGQTWQYRLMHLSGQLVEASNALNDHQTTLSVAHLPSGIYLLDIRRADGAGTVRKVVKP